MEPLLSLAVKLFGALGFKLLLILGAFAVAIIKFISEFINPPEKMLVDSSTNRTEEIKIDDAASVRDAVDGLYEDQTPVAKDSAESFHENQNQVVGGTTHGVVNTRI